MMQDFTCNIQNLQECFGIFRQFHQGFDQIDDGSSIARIQDMTRESPVAEIPRVFIRVDQAFNQRRVKPGNVSTLACKGKK